MPKEDFPYERYQQDENFYDTVAQCIQELKYGMVHSAHAWNTPVHDIRSVTHKFSGGRLEFTFHRYKVTNVEGLARMERDKEGQEFIKEIVKELKKRFKAHTGKALTMKEVDAAEGVEMASRLAAETSWVFGSRGRPMARYLLKSSVSYEISAKM